MAGETQIRGTIWCLRNKSGNILTYQKNSFDVTRYGATRTVNLSCPVCRQEIPIRVAGQREVYIMWAFAGLFLAVTVAAGAGVAERLPFPGGFVAALPTAIFGAILTFAIVYGLF